MNDEIIEAKPLIGYSVRPFVWFPLPHSNTGKEFTKIIKNTKCMMYDPYGIPYTALQRRVLEIITTKAKKERDYDNRISFDNISNVLAQYGMHRGGSYMKPLKNAIRQIGALAVSVEHSIMEDGKPAAMEVVNFQIAKDYRIEWMNGRMQAVMADGTLFNMNIMTLRDEFCREVDNAIPHNQKHYMSISSPYELDLYQWLVTKMYILNGRGGEDELVRWKELYTQFGDEVMSENQKKDFRRKTKELLFDIVSNYYTTAKSRFTDEGILLFKSPLLIEPEDKDAGYSLIN